MAVFSMPMEPTLSADFQGQGYIMIMYIYDVIIVFLADI